MSLPCCSSSENCEQHPLDLSGFRKLSDVKLGDFLDQHTHTPPPSVYVNVVNSTTYDEDDLHLVLSKALMISSPRPDSVLSNASGTFWPAVVPSSFESLGGTCSAMYYRETLQMNQTVGVQPLITFCNTPLPIVDHSESGLGSTITGSCGRRRKKIPQRSAKKFDPSFRGVSFLMRTRLNENYESSLAITASFK